VRPSTIIKAIRAELGPHLVKSNYKKFIPKNAKPSWGCCYVATEALYHLWGKENGYTPMRVKYKLNCQTMGMHWFLEQRASGLQVDITADQFTTRVPDFRKAVPCGFLTRQPSKRAQTIIDAVKKSLI
jgi:hypothetical protein